MNVHINTHMALLDLLILDQLNIFWSIVILNIFHNFCGIVNRAESPGVLQGHNLNLSLRYPFTK